LAIIAAWSFFAVCSAMPPPWAPSTTSPMIAMTIQGVLHVQNLCVM